MDKKPFSSKKFIAFLFSSILIVGAMIVAIVFQQIGWPLALFMSVLAIALGALSIGYIISQAALDKFLNGVQNVASSIVNKDNDKEV